MLPSRSRASPSPSLLLLVLFAWCFSLLQTEITAAAVASSSSSSTSASSVASSTADTMTRRGGRRDAVNHGAPTGGFRDDALPPSRRRRRRAATGTRGSGAGEEEVLLLRRRRRRLPRRPEDAPADRPMADDGFKTITVAPLPEEPAAGARGAAPGGPAAAGDADRMRLERDKQSRIKDIQTLIPMMIRRSNFTGFLNVPSNSTIDVSHLHPIRKITPFEPKCNIPKAVKDTWKEENLLYLYFNATYDPNATASVVIKLHRLPTDPNSTDQNGNVNSGEEIEKLLRVSIYWYSKQLGKKQKLKKRLCDSKVVTEKQNAVELNVKPAIISWLESQNFGFAVKVENQEEVALKASAYFKGDGCKATATASASQIVPISTDDQEIRRQILESYFLGLSPKIFVCTVESITGAPLAEKSFACQLDKELETDGHRRKQNSPIAENQQTHHLRHQKHLEENPERFESHFKRQHLDIRNFMENKTIHISKDDLDRLNSNNNNNNNNKRAVTR